MIMKTEYSFFIKDNGGLVDSIKLSCYG